LAGSNTRVPPGWDALEVQVAALSVERTRKPSSFVVPIKVPGANGSAAREPRTGAPVIIVQLLPPTSLRAR
jgi:hypothetical protein